MSHYRPAWCTVLPPPVSHRALGCSAHCCRAPWQSAHTAPPIAHSGRALSPKRRQPRASGDGGEDSDTPGSPGGSSPSFISLTGRTASGRARFRTRRRRSGQVPPAELPELEKSEEDFKREWGISREREVGRAPAGWGQRGAPAGMRRRRLIANPPLLSLSACPLLSFGA